MTSGESPTSKNRWPVLGLVCLIFGVALTAASCQRGPGLANTQETSDTTDQSTESQASTGFDIQNPDLGQSQSGTGVAPIAGLGLPDAVASKTLLDAELTKANESITTLQTDVVLKLVSMKFVNSYSDRTGLSTNYYIYSSPQNPQFYYLVNAPRNGEKIKRFIMPIEDLELPFDLLDLPKQFWKLSYIDAIKAGESKGGKDFVTQHPQFELSMILAQPAGQYLNWFLTYRATDGSGAILKIAVDAYSGEASIVR